MTVNTLIDMTGERYGRLTVLERTDSQGGKSMWRCRCSCGSEKTVRRSHLLSGVVRSCGCLNRSLSAARARRGLRKGVFTEHVTYGGAHIRVRIVRGAAGEHTCTCGQPATQWAYDHADPDELTEVRGLPRGRALEVPYSLDPSHYQPMCAPCHVRFDRNTRTTHHDKEIPA